MAKFVRIGNTPQSYLSNRQLVNWICDFFQKHGELDLWKYWIRHNN